MDLVVLAAGMGSRFGGLKQIKPIDHYGNFIIDFSIYDAIKVGFNKVVFVIKEENYEAFENSVAKRIRPFIKVEYAFQGPKSFLPEEYKNVVREKPWGTAHAIYAARDIIKDDFIIINGDDFYGRDAYEVAYKYLASLPKGAKGKYANVAFKVSNTMTENGSVKRGVCFEDKDHNLSKLVESSIERNKGGKIIATPLEGGEPFEVSEDTPVSMNLFCFNKDLMDHLRDRFPKWLEVHGNELKSEFLIPSVISELVGEGKASLKLLSTDSIWFGVTYKEDKPGVVRALKELVDKGEYKAGLY